MNAFPYRNALIVGAGSGISASLARALAAQGVKVALAARNVDKLRELTTQLGGSAFAVDAADPAGVAGLFTDVRQTLGDIDVVVYNAASRAQGPLADLDAATVERALAVTAFGAFLVTQQAARMMTAKGHGAILYTGATASLKGFAGSAAFAMGKFALRGLAQSAARELGPKGIHVAHFVIDGGVRSDARLPRAEQPDSMLEPDAVATTYLDVLRQHRSAWSQEVEVRPWVEHF